ncbi:MAG: hypothetical protein ACK56I_25405, partial [bacterium]
MEDAVCSGSQLWIAVKAAVGNVIDSERSILVLAVVELHVRPKILGAEGVLHALRQGRGREEGLQRIE